MFIYKIKYSSLPGRKVLSLHGQSLVNGFPILIANQLVQVLSLCYQGTPRYSSFLCLQKGCSFPFVEKEQGNLRTMMSQFSTVCSRLQKSKACHPNRVINYSDRSSVPTLLWKETVSSEFITTYFECLQHDILQTAKGNRTVCPCWGKWQLFKEHTILHYELDLTDTNKIFQNTRYNF